MRKTKLMARRILLLAAILLATNANLLFAQNKTVTGVVKDAVTKESIPGASVLVKGTQQGTITDLDGNYTLKVETGASLVYSFVGYETQEIAVANQSKIDVLLQEKLVGLAEFVAIGYGTQKKKDITGSVGASSKALYVSQAVDG